MNNKYVKKVVVTFIGFMLVFSNLSTDALRAEEKVLKTLTATLETMEVELSYDEGSIPEGSQLQVAVSTPEVTESMKNNAASLVEGTITEANAYDVSVVDTEGNNVTPTSPVTVTFKNMNMNTITNVFMQQDESVLDTEAEIVEKNATVITKSLSNFLFVNAEKPQAEEPAVDEPIVEVNEAEKVETKQANALSANLLGADISGSPVSFGFDLSLNNKGNYYLQIRVYDSSSNQLLQTLPQTGLYRFDEDELTVSLSYASNYSVDKACFNYINGNYSQSSVKNSISIKNNKVELDLKNRGSRNNTSRTNYLDIYITKETPKVEGSLSIISKLNQGDLSKEDYTFEQKKSYNYQIIDKTTEQALTGQIKYDLYDLNGKKLNSNSLYSEKDGVLQIKVDREVKVDLGSLGAESGKTYIIKQMNGDRYDTTYQVNSGNPVNGKETPAITLANQDNIVTFVNTRKPIKDIVSYDKTSNILNWDNRTYSVNLNAGYKSNEETIKENADVFFVLDISGSMIYTDAKIEGTGENSKVTMNDLEKEFIYFTKPFSDYGKGIKINEELITSKIPGAKITSKKSGDKDEYAYMGIKTDNDNKLIFYNGEKWQYLTVSQAGNENPIATDLKESDLASGVYTQRSSLLISSVTKFVEGMSDNCSVGIAVFGKSGSKKITLTKLNSNENRLNVQNAIKESYGKYNTGTYMGTGLEVVINDSNFKNSKNEKYVIAFTDGADSGEDNAISKATTLKVDSTVFTVGVGVSSENYGFLQKIASTPDNFLTSSKMSEIYDLLEIISDQIGNAFFRGTVKDYIDPRFDLIDQRGNVLKENDVITDSNNPSITGTVGRDNKGYYVVWMNQVVKTNPANSSYSWNTSITLRAKEDFLGGNVILTNQAGSNLTTSLSNQDILNFPMPSVNVKELSFSIENDQTEIEIGDAIKPTEYIKKLNGSISLTSLQLTDAEIQTLISSENKTLTKDYSYSNDKVGKLVYQLESITDGVDSVNWSNHNATHSSKSKNGAKVPVETYKLTVTYEPISVEERSKVVVADSYPTKDKVCSTIAATGTYEVYVKGGPEISLNKTASQTTDNDDRSFTINLTASSLDKTITDKTGAVDVILLLDCSGSMQGTGIKALNESVSSFIKELGAASPESRIAIIKYNDKATDVTKGFKLASKYTYNNISGSGSTNMNAAMQMAYLNYYTSNQSSYKTDPSHKQVLIAFTDGDNNEYVYGYPNDLPTLEANEYSGNYYDTVAIRYAKEFKQNRGVEIYSVGLGKLATSSYKFLQTIATKAEAPYYSYVKDVADLSDVFEGLTGQIITGNALSNVTITDTLTKEFKLTDTQKAEFDKQGVVYKENSDGTTTITWTNQTIPYSENGEKVWKGKINVVAKDDFLGGNYVPTNTEATLTYDKYEYEFPKPTVNVGLLNITLGNEDHLVFKGTQISPIDCIKELNSSINTASLRLSDDEIAELVKNETYTRPKYIYENDSNFGKIVYTLTKTGVDTIEDHVADTESAVDNAGRLSVEAYELKVEYVALTKEERIAYLNEQKVDLTAYTDPINDSKTSIYGFGAHQIYVASGELDIAKTINQQYTTEGKVNANQSFVFKITKKDLNGNVVDTFYQTISFSANENKTTKSVKIKGLDAGYYTVEEVQDWSWKYKLDKQSDNYSENKVENKEIYIGDTIEGNLFGVEEGFKIADKDYSSPAKSTFNNVKVTTGAISQIISDVASAINKFNN